jgi:hypothetical protein
MNFECQMPQKLALKSMRLSINGFRIPEDFSVQDLLEGDPIW